MDFSHLGVSSISADYSQLPEMGLGVAKTSEATRVRKEARYVSFMMKTRGGDRTKSARWVENRGTGGHRLLYVAMDDLEQFQIFRNICDLSANSTRLQQG